MKSFVLSIFVGLLGLPSFAHEGGGLVGAALMQRMIINQCITRAEVDPGVDRGSLETQYSDSDWSYLYIMGLKIYSTVAIYDYHGELITYRCDEHFPYLAHVHFFNGAKDETLLNLQAEIIRLRPELGSR